MSSKPPLVEIRTSPHIHQGAGVEQIMINVVYALLPLTAFSIFQYGISVLALTITVVLTVLGTERLFARLSAKKDTLGDYSATITALLLALT
ncbi:MAG: RnfABCDGE type electron transport complex subunit D, partial [Gammaproteobacteria bacterium]|nr:RnfABCDGE type electron transport complex subunit D [Gammaproteobacteria bacterium]